MKNRFTLTIIFFCLSVTTLSLQAAESENQIHVLIVSGGHDFEQKEFFAIFDQMKGITYDHLVQPKANEAFADGSTAHYDVVVLYDMFQPITAEQKEGFKKYLNSGKGFVSLHHSLANYQAWDEYLNILGGSYIWMKTDGKYTGNIILSQPISMMWIWRFR